MHARVTIAVSTCLALSLAGASAARAQDAAQKVLTGKAAFGDFRTDAPGLQRHITPDDLPPPREAEAASNPPSQVARPAGAMPKAPPGFTVDLVASGLQAPRTIRVAPNGDVFVAETRAGRILVLHPEANGTYGAPHVFAQGLRGVFGMVFPPSGEEARWFYVATTTQVLRFAYARGDQTAKGEPQVIVKRLPSGGHTTRDLAFSRDGRTLFVSVGSGSNVAEDMDAKPPTTPAAWDASRAPGATWDTEENRADVLAVDPEGGETRVYATGLRNCAGLTAEPASGDLWCAVNERDLLGDDLPPDYATRVEEHRFYGWPWFYIGAHEDPRLAGRRPDLAGKVTVPDVLLQPHSAPLQIAFYSGDQFPAAYKGSAFVTLHGSWNRAKRTGYKVVRLPFANGKPTGAYEDFLTGFVANDTSVWGRPVGVAVDASGALLVGEDASGTIWRVKAAKE